MTPQPPVPPRSFAARLASVRARGLFFARLVWRIGGRAVMQIRPPARALPAAPVAGMDAGLIADHDQIIEALQTGDTGLLDRLGPEFASSIDVDSGQPWLFHAVELGNLASLRWFLAQGAALDVAYLRQWGGALRVDDLVARALAAAEG